MNTENQEELTQEELLYLASKGYKAPGAPTSKSDPNNPPETNPDALTEEETNYIRNLKNKNHGNK